MQEISHKLSIGIASVIALLGQLSCAYAQNFDGAWDGYYICGGHVLKSELSAFAWPRVNFNTANGLISARRDFINRFQIPMVAVFNGTVDGSGSVKIDVISRRQSDANEDFHQTLEGRSVSPGVIELTGLMLTPKGVPVRDGSSRTG